LTEGVSSLPGPFIHNIDPVFGEVEGFYLWWYGLSYTLGSVGLFLWVLIHRGPLKMSRKEVYDLSIFVAAGVLIGGRMVEVIFYEWSYYGSHLWHIPALWLGGMSTHGILLGALSGTFLFCRRYGRSFLEIADVIVIAGAFIMGVGRLGNFIDGQIVGRVTEVWWGVKFPDLEGFRHPVVLYDGLKNLLLIPLLLFIRRRKPPRGAILAHSILWYGFLRIFVDFFREYRTALFGFPPGQEFNILMTFLGLSMLWWFYHKERVTGKNGLKDVRMYSRASGRSGLWPRRLIFLLILVVPMVIPSDWTQDIPERYSKRHPEISYSSIYPRIRSSER